MNIVGVFYSYPNELYAQIDELYPNMLGFKFDIELVLSNNNSIKSFKEKAKNTLGFLILRFNEDLSKSLDVYFRFSGSAKLGKDYYVKGSIEPYRYENIDQNTTYITIPSFSNFYILTIFPKRIVGRFDYKTIVCRLFDVGDYRILEDNSYARSFLLYDKTHSIKNINPKSNIFLPRESQHNLSNSDLKKYDTYFIDILDTNSYEIDKNYSNITKKMDDIINDNNNNIIQKTMKEITSYLESSLVNLENRVPLNFRVNNNSLNFNYRFKSIRAVNSNSVFCNSFDIEVLSYPIYNNYDFNKKKLEFIVNGDYGLFNFIVFGDIKLDIVNVILFILGKGLAPSLLLQINRYPNKQSDLIRLEKVVGSNIEKLVAYYVKIDLFSCLAYSNPTTFTLDVKKGLL